MNESNIERKVIGEDDEKDGRKMRDAKENALNEDGPAASCGGLGTGNSKRITGNSVTGLLLLEALQELHNVAHPDVRLINWKNQRPGFAANNHY